MQMWNGDMRTIRDNCQKLIARLLFESVDCRVSPRADCDWETAGVLVDTHQELIDLAVKSLALCNWFTFRTDFSVLTTLVDSGGFHENCYHIFRENFRQWHEELPKDKYGAMRSFEHLLDSDRHTFTC